MGIINNKLTVKWNPANRKHYENKGYEFIGWGESFQVWWYDLSCGSHTNLEVQCDECKTRLKVRPNTYKEHAKENKYYCRSCSQLLFGAKTRDKYIKKTFKDWCDTTNRQYILDLWDYEANTKSPSEVSFQTNKKYLFKCENGKHESQLYCIKSIVVSNNFKFKCVKCNSFAQWGISNLGKDFLKKYWDYGKNIDDPWKLNVKSSKYVYILCQKLKYHKAYKILVSDFTKGVRCGFCYGAKTHPLDSLGEIHSTCISLWGEKNIKTPYDYKPHSAVSVFWKCHNSKHEDYKRKINLSTNLEFRCPRCYYSLGEITIENFLESSNTEYICQKKYKNLKGVKGKCLSFDFYLPSYNLLIEYQGEYHDGSNGVATIQTPEMLKVQQEHDKRKREYAKNNNIELLEIWYYDFDNIDEILSNKLKTKGVI